MCMHVCIPSPNGFFGGFLASVFSQLDPVNPSGQYLHEFSLNLVENTL